MNIVGLNVFITVSDVIVCKGCSCRPLFTTDLFRFINFDLALPVNPLYLVGTACPLLAVLESICIGI